MTPQNAASHLGLLCLHREISSKNEFKEIKTTPNTPTNESGLNQLITMEESIRQIWVNLITMNDVGWNLAYKRKVGLINSFMPGVPFIGHRQTK